MSRHVFISYSRRDGEWADALATGLRARGLQVWIDQTSIPSSVPWRAEIFHAVRGSLAVVVVDSLAARASPHCQDELSMARAASRPLVSVEPSTCSPAAAVTRVESEILGLEIDDVVAAELMARASRWVAGGRSAQALSRGGVLRAYNRGCRTRSFLRDDPAVTEFLRASKRRRARRVAVSTALVLGFLALLVVPRAVQDSSQRLIDRYQTSEARLQRFTAAYDATSTDPRAGLVEVVDLLAAAPTMSHGESFLSSRVLGLHLPRPATAAEQTMPLSVVTTSPSSARTLRLSDDRHTVRVLDRGGKLELEIDRPSRIVAVAWDPSGTDLAIADTHSVGVYNALTGERWSELVASAGVRRLAYVGAGTLVAARADGRRLAWDDRQGTAVARDDSWWFMKSALAPDGRTGAITRGGSVVEVDSSGSTARVVARIENATAYSITASPTSWVVGGADATGSGVVWSVPFGGGEPTVATAQGCLPRDLIWNDHRGLVVACVIDGAFGTWDGQAPSVTVRPSGTVSVESVANLGDDVVLAGGPSEYMVLEPNSDEPRLGRTGIDSCGGGARVLAGSPRGRYVFSAGTGLDSGCLARVALTGAADTDFFPFSGETNESRAISISPDGLYVALGTGDGEVWVYSTVGLNLMQASHVSGQEIRGVTFTPDGESMVVLTRGGEIVRLPMTAAAPLPARVETIRRTLDALPSD